MVAQYPPTWIAESAANYPPTAQAWYPPDSNNTTGSALLLETSEFLLTETGDRVLLEV